MTSYPTISILVAEDSPVIQTVLRGMLLHWGFDVTTTTNGIEALEILRRLDGPRMAIVDWMMPGMQGPELCRQLRAEQRELYTYILLLTSRDTAADVVEGLEAGADDYLTKPFHAQELRARVRAGSRIVQLQREILEARDKLRRQAATDPLTGLLNRLAIVEALERDLRAADRAGYPLTILLVDVDRFRQINESFGHTAGDAVLREVGRRLTDAAPPGSSLGRYSGQEFLMVLPGATTAETDGLGEAIRGALSAELFVAGAASFPVTCTVGTAGVGMPLSADAASLLRAADDAILAAKRAARERLAGAQRVSTNLFPRICARA